MGKSEQASTNVGVVITPAILAAAVVTCIDYFGQLGAPAAIAAALTTIFTAIFVYLAPWLPRRAHAG